MMQEEGLSIFPARKEATCLRAPQTPPRSRFRATGAARILHDPDFEPRERRGSSTVPISRHPPSAESSTVPISCRGILHGAVFFPTWVSAWNESGFVEDFSGDTGGGVGHIPSSQGRGVFLDIEKSSTVPVLRHGSGYDGTNRGPWRIPPHVHGRKVGSWRISGSSCGANWGSWRISPHAHSVKAETRGVSPRLWG